eukprot:9167539-Alexandrium_andersonii.AAC.1
MRAGRDLPRENAPKKRAPVWGGQVPVHVAIVTGSAGQHRGAAKRLSTTVRTIARGKFSPARNSLKQVRAVPSSVGQSR